MYDIAFETISQACCDPEGGSECCVWDVGTEGNFLYMDKLC